jgi:SAM-dependent methyltransferase
LSQQSGAARIFLYNWPVYAGAWLGAAVVVALVPRMPREIMPWALLAACGSVLWSVVSLAVSFYVYDRSGLARGAWVAPLLGQDARTWAAVHAGLDAEIELDAAMPGSCVGRLDIFDPKTMTAPSIRRARIRTAQEHPSTACVPTALALPDGACDTLVVAFTAHEIRDRSARERFFVEIRRCLRPGGRMLLVEHLRDVANLVAFGPGFLHFVARSEWLRLAEHAGLRIAVERRVTPFVMALVLEKEA